MKYFFLLFFSLPFFAQSQYYVLVDRDLKMPVEVTTKLESQKIAPFYFPVHSQDLDAVIKAVDQYINYLDGARTPLINEEVKLGNSRMLVNNSEEREAKGFSVYLTTRAKDSGFGLEIVSKKDSKRRGLQKMKAFLDYLRNNQFLVEETQTLSKQ